mmetsp:Transcript_22564/g.19557  ORF Transcript_22564/g.19557 Transcript_22564/m.19557 type:complete len:183 (+) Transcript_22564:759-1307(+)
MKELDLTKLANAIESLIDRFTHNDRLSLLFYDQYAYRSTPLMKMDEDGKDSIRQKFREIYFNGESDLSDAMGHAIEILKQRKNQNSFASIFMLSCTEASQKSLDELEYMFRNCSNQKMSLNLFALNKDFSEIQLQWMDSFFPGDRYKVNNDMSNLKNDLQTAFNKCTNFSFNNTEIFYIFNH